MRCLLKLVLAGRRSRKRRLAGAASPAPQTRAAAGESAEEATPRARAV